MERLTKWVDGEWRENHDNETRETKNKNGGRACMTKLAEYEKTGLTPQEVAELIRAEFQQTEEIATPLCKVGDIIYHKALFEEGYFKVIITRVLVNKQRVVYVAKSADSGNSYIFNQNDFGTKTFLTEAEAQ